MAADCHVLRFGSGAAADSQHTDLVFQSGSLSTSGIKKMRPPKHRSQSLKAKVPRRTLSGGALQLARFLSFCLLLV